VLSAKHVPAAALRIKFVRVIPRFDEHVVDHVLGLRGLAKMRVTSAVNRRACGRRARPCLPLAR